MTCSYTASTRTGTKYIFCIYFVSPGVSPGWAEQRFWVMGRCAVGAAQMKVTWLRAVPTSDWSGSFTATSPPAALARLQQPCEAIPAGNGRAGAVWWLSIKHRV